MNAGRELDALVAERVFGRIVDYGRHGPGQLIATNPRDEDDNWHDLPPYSTDIAAAWQVLEAVAVKGTDFYIEYSPSPYALYWCRFNDTTQGTWTKSGGSEDKRRGDAHASTAPHAICLAALEAVGVED
jgi:hypothetical protein